MTASDDTVLPEPLSPTRPRVSPAPIVKLDVVDDRQPAVGARELDAAARSTASSAAAAAVLDVGARGLAP